MTRIYPEQDFFDEIQTPSYFTLSNEHYLIVTGKKEELLMCPKYRSGKSCDPGAYVPQIGLKIMI